jgi:hypothetical protein
MRQPQDGFAFDTLYNLSHFSPIATPRPKKTRKTGSFPVIRLIFLLPGCIFNKKSEN